MKVCLEQILRVLESGMDIGAFGIESLGLPNYIVFSLFEVIDQIDMAD